MQILLEGKEALDYLTYIKEQAKSLDKVTSLMDKVESRMSKPLSANFQSTEEIVKHNREVHSITTEKDIADDIMSEVEQPLVDTREVSSEFPTREPKQKYYKWTVGDIRTLHTCAMSSRASNHSIDYIHTRFNTELVSRKAVIAQLYRLGYKIKKGVVCQPN